MGYEALRLCRFVRPAERNVTVRQRCGFAASYRIPFRNVSQRGRTALHHRIKPTCEDLLTDTKYRSFYL